MPQKQILSPDEPLVPLMVRLPESLHQWVRQQAKEQHRSLNAQIVSMLQVLKDKDSPTT